MRGSQEAIGAPDRSEVLLPGQIAWRYSAAEVWADGVIHAIGLGFAVIGAAILLTAISSAPGARVTAVAVYLATLIASIAASAAYNIWPVSRVKWLLRRFDHSAIYLLIAGTYTPFMALLGTWWLLSVIWVVAIVGVVLKIACPGRFDRLSILLYLVLGWSGVLIFDRLVSTLDPAALWLIVLGGVVYTLGVNFHLWDRLRFQNAIWHGFVLTAAVIHYAAVWVAVSA